MEILVISILILVNGVFSLIEAAFLSARKSVLHSLSRKGSKQAAFLLRQHADPERFLSSIQVCITLVGVVSGAFGGLALADDLGRLLQAWGLAGELARNLALVGVIGLITYFSIVLGELVPKTFAMKNPERIAVFFSPLIKLVMLVFRPVVGLLSLSTKAVLLLSGMRHRVPDPDLVNELVSIIKMASSQNELEKEQEKIILNTINATKAKIHDIMVAREEIKYVRHSDNIDYILQVMFQYRHTRYPVIGEGLNQVEGYVNLKDLSYYQISGYQGLSIATLMRPIARFNHNLSIIDALKAMMLKNSHIAIAVDKKQRTVGLVTLEDIIEALIGDINDEYDSLPDYVFVMAPDNYIVGAGARMASLGDLMALGEADASQSVANWLHARQVNPVVGTSHRSGPCQFIVTKVRNAKIIEVMVRLRQEP